MLSVSTRNSVNTHRVYRERPQNSRNTILKINQYKQNLIHKRSTWAVANLSSVELNYTRPLFKHIYISNILFSLSTVFKTTSINALYIY